MIFACYFAAVTCSTAFGWIRIVNVIRNHERDACRFTDTHRSQQVLRLHGNQLCYFLLQFTLLSINQRENNKILWQLNDITAHWVTASERGSEIAVLTKQCTCQWAYICLYIWNLIVYRRVYLGVFDSSSTLKSGE